MQTTKAKQSGFTIVEGILIVVALVALVGGGWLVYQHVKQSATRTDAAQNPNQSTQQTPAPPAQTVAYLTITEWGIKIPLSDTIKDAKYILSDSIVDPQGRPAGAWVTTVNAEANSCTLSNQNQDGGNAIGEIMRIEPGQQDGVTGELLTKEFPNGTTVGGYNYAYESWAGRNTCVSAAEQQTLDGAFGSAVNGQIKPSN
jgi:Tfp pilus assembly protein PilV